MGGKIVVEIDIVLYEFDYSSILSAGLAVGLFIGSLVSFVCRGIDIFVESLKF